MNTAQEFIAYAALHNIELSVIENQLIMDGVKAEVKDQFLNIAKEHKQEILKELSEKELIQQAFREGKSIRWWSGVLKEWIWFSPDKASAQAKKKETDEVVYHKGEIEALTGWDKQDIKTIHGLKKEFDGEISK